MAGVSADEWHMPNTQAFLTPVLIAVMKANIVSMCHGDIDIMCNKLWTQNILNWFVWRKLRLILISYNYEYSLKNYRFSLSSSKVSALTDEIN